jgi:hypothetical protein
VTKHKKYEGSKKRRNNIGNRKKKEDRIKIK